MNHKDWDFVNRRLVAKMLSEMEYEQVFHAESQGDDHYCINLPGAQWRFIAERGIWGWLWIDAQTLRCTDEPVLAQTLLMQLKPVLSMVMPLLQSICRICMPRYWATCNC